MKRIIFFAVLFCLLMGITAKAQQKPNIIYEELYSIKKDPREKTNLAANKKHTRRLQMLRKKYHSLKQEMP